MWRARLEGEGDEYGTVRYGIRERKSAGWVRVFLDEPLPNLRRGAKERSLASTVACCLSQG